ncbi:MAG: thioesterase family protein [Hyphomicrobium sp.]
MTAADLGDLKPGLTGRAALVVSEATSARGVGSGSLAVLASPMMVALMEAAAVDCVEHLLPAGTTSVGIHLDVFHDGPTPIGEEVQATAVLEQIEDRLLVFRVEARDRFEIVGHGQHRRMVVGIDRFLRKLAAKSG